MAIHISDSMTAPVDTKGVLNSLIGQVCDGSPAYSMDGMALTTKWKGPYIRLKELQIVDQPLLTALNTIPLQVYANFTLPTPPTGTQWWITRTQVEQLEAGDHGLLTIDCEAKVGQGGSGGQFDPYQDTWNLRWESYVVKPAAFCSNEAHSDYSLTDPNVQPGAFLQGKASREHIDMFLNGNDKGVSKGHKWYRDDTGNGWYLTGAEELVANKALQDKSALWHYPVLTHTTVKNYYSSNISAVLSNTVAYDEKIGQKIDYLVGGSANPAQVPEGCPYKFGDDWQWIKTGDDMQHVKTRGKISFMRTETFMGVVSADVNYYGDGAFQPTELSSCRWEIGKL